MKITRAMVLAFGLVALGCAGGEDAETEALPEATTPPPVPAPAPDTSLVTDTTARDTTATTTHD